MALIGILASAILLLGKRPLISLGIFWFFAGHSLESSIFPLEIAHEHRNYLADYGILLALASALAEAPLHRLAPIVNYAVPAVLFLVFSYTTWLRSEQWSDNINQAVYEARHHPESLRSVFAAGRIHARLTLSGHTESEAMAFDFLDKARTLDKTGIMADVTMIKLDYLLHKPVEQQLFDAVLYKLSHFPLTASDVSSIKALADCTPKTCVIPDATIEAIFKQALRNEDVDVLTIYGYYSINKKQDFSKGLELFERAVELDPREPQRWKNLINLLIVMQRFDDAQRELEQFSAAETYGNNARDCRLLQEDINRVRQQYLSQARLEATEDN
jgi:tetratricopeptide (TPR) repeat protein